VTAARDRRPRWAFVVIDCARPDAGRPWPDGGLGHAHGPPAGFYVVGFVLRGRAAGEVRCASRIYGTREQAEREAKRLRADFVARDRADERRQAEARQRRLAARRARRRRP
jgi:hypothetical protein